MASSPFPSPRDEPAPTANARRRPRGAADRLGDGLLAGLVAASATAGAMAGFALRQPGGATAPFAASGRMLLGVAEVDAGAVQLAALGAGVALHVALVAAWAALFALLVGTLRGARLAAAAALFAGAVYLVSEAALPPLLRLGHGVRAFPPQLAVLYIVLAVGLALGMRIALVDRREGGRGESIM